MADSVRSGDIGEQIRNYVACTINQAISTLDDSDDDSVPAFERVIPSQTPVQPLNDVQSVNEDSSERAKPDVEPKPSQPKLTINTEPIEEVLEDIVTGLNIVNMVDKTYHFVLRSGISVLSFFRDSVDLTSYLFGGISGMQRLSSWLSCKIQSLKTYKINRSYFEIGDKIKQSIIAAKKEISIVLLWCYEKLWAVDLHQPKRDDFCLHVDLGGLSIFPIYQQKINFPLLSRTMASCFNGAYFDMHTTQEVRIDEGFSKEEIEQKIDYLSHDFNIKLDGNKVFIEAVYSGQLEPHFKKFYSTKYGLNMDDLRRRVKHHGGHNKLRFQANYYMAKNLNRIIENMDNYVVIVDVGAKYRKMSGFLNEVNKSLQHVGKCIYYLPIRPTDASEDDKTYFDENAKIYEKFTLRKGAWQYPLISGYFGKERTNNRLVRALKD